MDYNWSIKELDKNKNNITVMSCFSGSGGSSMGYKLNGCTVLANVEIDKKQNLMYTKNLNPKYNYNMDIRDVVQMAKNKELPDELYELDILDGSPPCSTFSMAGLREKGWGKEKKFREGQKEQTLDDLFFVFGDLIKELKPKMVIGENVKGILMGAAKEGYAEPIIKMYKSMGYYAKYITLYANKMGVPQKRGRVFFIGVRKDMCSLEHFNNTINSLVFNQKDITFGEVRERIPQIGREIPKDTKTRELWELHKKGSDTSLQNAYNILTGKIGHFGDVILISDYTSSTLKAGGTMLYDEIPNYLSKEHMVAIQSYPYDYNFIPDSNNNIKYTLGMSVPPLMTKAISEKLINHIFKKVPFEFDTLDKW